MMSKFFRVGVMVAGVAMLVGAVSACSDDSTASAPITSDPITTTSMYSSPAASSATSAAPGSTTQKVTTPVSGATKLPATAPTTGTTVPPSFPGPNGEPVSAKGQKYLAALKAQNVTFMGDTDNTVALNAADYVCAQQAKGADPTTVKAFVTALVGPGTQNVNEAGAKADKVIKAAHENYC
ncbi:MULTISPECIES: DUF732 domain-containing protein [unclassified Gordonia (in: high G+C Gram-positive bacteria)]